MTKPGRELSLQACDYRFTLRCSDDDLAALLASVFGALVTTAAASERSHSHYFIDATTDGAYRVASTSGTVQLATVHDLLIYLDKSITIKLQHLRPDLLFVHGAALAWQGRVAVLSAPPGTGKSTLTLVARQLGLEYFSDELAPIDLDRLTVYPYPRAIYLKAPPPPPHALPSGAIDHGERYHLPLTADAAPRLDAALTALIFLRRDKETFDGLRPISAASGAARLIANTLNLLAHPAVGIDAAVAVSRAVSCFELDITDLMAASESIRAQLDAPLS